jgi:hypothetical protein
MATLAEWRGFRIKITEVEDKDRIEDKDFLSQINRTDCFWKSAVQQTHIWLWSLFLRTITNSKQGTAQSRNSKQQIYSDTLALILLVDLYKPI